MQYDHAVVQHVQRYNINNFFIETDQNLGMRLVKQLQSKQENQFFPSLSNQICKNISRAVMFSNCLHDCILLHWSVYQCIFCHETTVSCSETVLYFIFDPSCVQQNDSRLLFFSFLKTTSLFYSCRICLHGNTIETLSIQFCCCCRYFRRRKLCKFIGCKGMKGRLYK